MELGRWDLAWQNAIYWHLVTWFRFQSRTSADFWSMEVIFTTKHNMTPISNWFIKGQSSKTLQFNTLVSTDNQLTNLNHTNQIHFIDYAAKIRSSINRSENKINFAMVLKVKTSWNNAVNKCKETMIGFKNIDIATGRLSVEINVLKDSSDFNVGCKYIQNFYPK